MQQQRQLSCLKRKQREDDDDDEMTLSSIHHQRVQKTPKILEEEEESRMIQKQSTFIDIIGDDDDVKKEEEEGRKKKIKLLKDLLQFHKNVKVYSVPSWLNKEESSALFDQLMTCVKFRIDVFKIYGKECTSPRGTASFGNPGTAYRFSGVEHRSVPLNDPTSPYYDHYLKQQQQQQDDDDERKNYWPPFLYSLLIRLERWFTTFFLPVLNEKKKNSSHHDDDDDEEDTAIRFDYVLINYYANGNNYIGYHSDDERDLKKNGIIASLSLGASRDFCFQMKKSMYVCMSII